MEIPMNDCNYADKGIIDEMTSKIISELRESDTSYVYSYKTPYGESVAKVVGKAFKEKGYHVAYDYIPNGYRNIIVSRLPIGEPSGLLVSRRWEY